MSVVRSHPWAGPLAIAVVLATANASAEPTCEGWFCGSDSPSAAVTPTSEPEVAPTPDTIWPWTQALEVTILEVVPGHHVTLRLPDGSLRNLPWPFFLQLSVSGRLIVRPVSEPAPLPPPAPPPPSEPIPTPAPRQEPDQPAETKPTPIPTSDANESLDDFDPHWTIGLRIAGEVATRDSMLSQGMPLRHFAGPGLGLEFDLGFSPAPSWMPYVFGQLTRYADGDDNQGHTAATSALVGLGMRINTDPLNTGFVLDFSVGHRWLNVPYGPGDTNFATNTNEGTLHLRGFGEMRLATGIAFGHGRQGVRHSVLLSGSVGSFTNMSDSGGVCFSPNACDEIPANARSAHLFGGIIFGSELDL